jgi:hypothetical protein
MARYGRLAVRSQPETEGRPERRRRPAGRLLVAEDAVCRDGVVSTAVLTTPDWLCVVVGGRSPPKRLGRLNGRLVPPSVGFSPGRARRNLDRAPFQAGIFASS